MRPAAKTSARGAVGLERVAGLAVFAVGALAGAACQSIAALECPGGATTCVDASAIDARSSVEAGPDTSGIPCMAAGGTLPGPPTAYCTPPNQECCYRTNGASTVDCEATGGGCPTDIECDRPSQCGGQPCWICLDDSSGLLGTGCNVGDLACTAGDTLLPLCADPGDCDAGQTCAPQSVVDFASGWFKTCQ